MLGKLFNRLAKKNGIPVSKKIVRGLKDDALLDIIQRQTLRYFWDFGHPVSGMALERSSGSINYDCANTVTTGGTGFGIMAMIAGAERGWLPRREVFNRFERIVGFLEKADRNYGAFSHFMNGTTAKTIPFGPMDDGADIVETSLLMMGLLTARQYMKRHASRKTEALCKRIDTLWQDVEWNRFKAPSWPDILAWHWSPNYGFIKNMPVQGWNEGLIAYVLGTASPTYPISPEMYHKGWTRGRDFINGKTYGIHTLPLGPDKGGPLFMSQYSFLGLDPRGLRDKYADYWEQNFMHTLINRQHCVDNPGGFKGYGPKSWGLTASDGDKGYNAHSPTEDAGVISPTAALSAFPYAPHYSMEALRYFYEEKGADLWSPFGFKDAFNETAGWTAQSHLAIDQGPIVVMIENYRSGLLWNLFMSCPEVKQSLEKLGFESPHLKKQRDRNNDLEPALG